MIRIRIGSWLFQDRASKRTIVKRSYLNKACKKNFTFFFFFPPPFFHRLPPDNASNACKLGLIGLMRMYSVWMASANYALSFSRHVVYTILILHVLLHPPRLIALSRGPGCLYYSDSLWRTVADNVRNGFDDQFVACCSHGYPGAIGELLFVHSRIIFFSIMKNSFQQ